MPTARQQPLSKAAYEQRLGPLLNEQVAPALTVALANGGIADPHKLSQAIRIVQAAHDQMAALTPPTAVADLQRQAVTALASWIGDATKLGDAENRHDSAAESSAGKALDGDARQVQSIGSQFTSRGY